MEFHKIANIFPLMDGDEFDQLVTDIKQNGLLVPIIMYEGQIIDGRNRYRACLEADIEPRYEQYNGTDPLEYIISINLHRRHLNESQRALIAAKIKPMFEVEAKERQIRKPINSVSANLRPQKKHKSSADAAKLFNVSPRLVESASKILKNGDEKLIETIEQGKKKVSAVARELKIAKQIKEIENGEIELPKGLYEIIVIDPPWNYNSKYDSDGFRGTTDYPEMTLDELKKMNIPASENSILFLWTTKAFIWNAKELLDCWSFKYRDILIWDKEKMGIGKLLRLQTELCLVGIKGKPVIKSHDCRDIIREPRRQHSRKPEAFYELVDHLCVGRKLDIFGREQRKNWDIWGKESKWDNSIMI